MKRSFCVIFIVSMLVSCSSSDDNVAIGDLAYDDLYGNVKSCDSYGKYHISHEYSKDGYTLGNRFSDDKRYDKRGRLCGYMLEFETHIYYDKNNRVKKIVDDKSFMHDRTVCRYYYDESGVLKRAKYSDGDEFRYYNHVLDSHGNWTKRISRFYDSEGNLKEKVVEEREIEYYPD